MDTHLNLHSGKPTPPWKIDHLKMYFLLKRGIFRCYVSLVMFFVSICKLLIPNCNSSILKFLDRFAKLMSRRKYHQKKNRWMKPSIFIPFRVMFKSPNSRDMNLRRILHPQEPPTKVKDTKPSKSGHLHWQTSKIGWQEFRCGNLDQRCDLRVICYSSNFEYDL